MLEPENIDLRLDEHGGFMARIELMKGSYAYMHLFPACVVHGIQTTTEENSESPFWKDFCKLVEGMDGPLQTITLDGQEFLYFIVPAMT